MCYGNSDHAYQMVQACSSKAVTWVVTSVKAVKGHFLPKAKDEESVSTRGFRVHASGSDRPIRISHLPERFRLVVVAAGPPNLVHVLSVLWVVDEDLKGHRKSYGNQKSSGTKYLSYNIIYLYIYMGNRWETKIGIGNIMNITLQSPRGGPHPATQPLPCC